MCRFVHFTDVTPTHGPWLNAFVQGQSQAMLAQISYHYLRAAATGAFDVREHPGDVSIGQLFPRQSVHFERYAAYPLEPFVGLKLLRSKYHAEDLEVYREDVMIDWKTRAGGILYAVWAGSSFWNMMLCFHSRMRTTGIQAWDTLLAQWEASGFQKRLLPCMTFAHVTGCLDPECPFMHNERVARADREVVLAYRRAECGRLTAEDVARYHEGQAAELSPVDDGLLVERIRRHILHPDVPICWNVECHTLDHLRCGKINFKDCERCTIASYCSDLCQHMNWERHQPGCYPLARIIEDDELWLPMGARIGTDRNGIVFSREGVMVPGCSPRLLSPSSPVRFGAPSNSIVWRGHTGYTFLT